jgi:hypothetical protein
VYPVPPVTSFSEVTEPDIAAVAFAVPLEKVTVGTEV